MNNDEWFRPYNAPESKVTKKRSFNTKANYIYFGAGLVTVGLMVFFLISAISTAYEMQRLLSS